jgi:hypothetical protein
MRPMTHLRDLPGEIFVKILAHLNYKELLRTRTVSDYCSCVAPPVTLTPRRKVSRFWAHVIDASEVLKYVVWLGIHAKLDGDSSVSLSCKISGLLEHERKWLTLTATQEDLHLVDQRNTSQFHLSGLNGSYLLTDIHEEHTLRRGQLASTLSNTDNWIDDPIYIPKHKRELSVVDVSKDLLIVP